MRIRTGFYRRPGGVHRRGRRLALALAFCVVQTGVMSTAPAVSFAAEPSFHASLDPNAVKESMQYLIDTYGVSKKEALRRLELQNDAQKLEKLLTAKRPGSYGGMRMDQANGGRLVLSMTSPADAQPFIRSMPDKAHVETRVVPHSLRQLEQVRKGVSQQVGEDADAVYLTSIDEEKNSVVLWERDWVAQSKANGTWAEESGTRAPMVAAPATYKKAVAVERANANAAVNAVPALARTAGVAAPVAVERRVLPRPKQNYTPYVDWAYCHPLYCKSTYGGMRGGLRLNIQRDNGSWGGCTSGFNVRSYGGNYAGWGWVLTAGHCVVGKTNATKVHHNGYNILNPHGVAGGYYMERNAYPYDFALLSYVDGTQSTSWLENQTYRNKVMKYCRNGGMDSDSDTPCGAQASLDTEYISGFHSLSEIKGGWVVCASGAGSNPANYPESYDSGAGSGYLVGTRCGKVLSTDVGINTDLCARAGDSGGPLFSQLDHTAYGILEGNQQNRSGACYAGEKNNYSPISKIYEQLQVWKDGGYTGGAVFSVIQAAKG
jgi:streptogrisin C